MNQQLLQGKANGKSIAIINLSGRWCVLTQVFAILMRCFRIEGTTIPPPVAVRLCTPMMVLMLVLNLQMNQQLLQGKANGKSIAIINLSGRWCVLTQVFAILMRCFRIEGATIPPACRCASVYSDDGVDASDIESLPFGWRTGPSRLGIIAGKLNQLRQFDAAAALWVAVWIRPRRLLHLHGQINPTVTTHV